MYTLYYSPGACSMAPHVILNELGQDFKLEHAGKPRTPEFLKVNPRGSVPVLSDDGFIIREGAAIIIYLLDKHKSPLLPAAGKERAAALEWLMFCNATLHPAFSKAFQAGSFSGQTQADVSEAAFAQINKLWADVETRLAQSPYLAGKEITAADILLTVIGNWSVNFPKISLAAKTKQLLKNVSSRPAFQKALAAEKVQYKAAA